MRLILFDSLCGRGKLRVMNGSSKHMGLANLFVEIHGSRSRFFSAYVFLALAVWIFSQSCHRVSIFYNAKEVLRH